MTRRKKGKPWQPKGGYAPRTFTSLDSPKTPLERQADAILKRDANRRAKRRPV